MTRCDFDPCDGIPGTEMIASPREYRLVCYVIRHNATYHSITTSTRGSAIRCTTHGLTCDLVPLICDVYRARAQAENGLCGRIWASSRDE